MAILRTDELTKPLFAISDDLERAEKDLVAYDDPYSRRNYIRALFAVIELTIYVLKQTLLVASTSGAGKLTFAELVLLREETFDLENNGQVRTQNNKFLRLADNLRFTARCVEKGFGLSLKLNTADRGWDDFKKAIKIRNRITHPKGHQEFDVSQQEAELAVRVGHWFAAFVVDWFGKFIATARPVYETDNDTTGEYKM